MVFHPLKVELLKRGLSQHLLAKQLDMSEKTLSNKVCGKTDFTRGEIVRICQVLCINDPKDIFFQELTT